MVDCNIDSFESEKSCLIDQFKMAFDDNKNFSCEQDAINFFNDCYYDCDTFEKESICKYKNQMEERVICSECVVIQNELLEMIRTVSENHEEWDDLRSILLEKETITPLLF